MTARLLPALALLLLVAGCGGDDGRQRLTVHAAASLAEPFTELAADFESAHDGVDVELLLGPSTTLAGTVADGGPGDVLATADRESMAVAAGALAAQPEVFAANRLVLVTRTTGPAVTSLADLRGSTWVRCADEVPCGRVAVAALADAGVEAAPASLEVDVKAVLEKVVSGEADAGLVYASDALSAGGEVATTAIPGSAAFPAIYSIAPLEQATQPALASDWIDLVTSAAGRAALEDAGFSRP